MFSKIGEFFIDCINGRKYKRELEELKKEVRSVLKEKKQEARKECSNQEPIKLKPLASTAPEIVHCKAIINGKLYDTEKTEKICNCGMIGALFKTKAGNYFRCEMTFPYRDYNVSDYLRNLKTTLENNKIMYHSITPITQEEVKNYLGNWDIDKYIELFGEVEEA